MMVGREEELEDLCLIVSGSLIFLILLWVISTCIFLSYRKQPCHGMMFTKLN